MSMSAPNSSGNRQKHGYLGCFHAASARENISGVCVIDDIIDSGNDLVLNKPSHGSVVTLIHGIIWHH